METILHVSNALYEKKYLITFNKYDNIIILSDGTILTSEPKGVPWVNGTIDKNNARHFDILTTVVRVGPFNGIFNKVPIIPENKVKNH